MATSPRSPGRHTYAVSRSGAAAGRGRRRGSSPREGSMRIPAKLMAFGLAAVLAGASSAQAADYFTLSSTSFKDGGRLDLKYGGNVPGVASCLGQNVSPALSWSNPPAG